jgi:uncharacterized protein (DUF1778 family)
MRKTAQLQIRVSPAEKAELRRQAARAGLDVSSYVLARAMPARAGRFANIVGQLADVNTRSHAFAELLDLLADVTPAEFPDATVGHILEPLDPWVQNYVAALVEQAARQKRVPPPAWVADIAPLAHPYFATTLRSLRTYLLAATPAVFKRRNIFTDAGVGARV